MKKRLALLALAVFFLPRAASGAPSLVEVHERSAGAMEAAAADGTFKIEGIQGRFTFDLELGGPVYQSVRAPFSGIFNRDFGPRLEGAGFFRADLGSAEHGNARRFMLEATSSQVSFFLARDGDDLTIFSPQLNFLVRDDFSRLARVYEENRSAVPGLPGVRIPELGGREMSVYLRLLAAVVRRAGEGVPAGKPAEAVMVGEHRCYLVSFPGERGAVNTLAVRAESWTPAFLEVTSPGGDMTTRFTFRAPEAGPPAIRHYLPVGLTVSGERDGNRFAMTVSGLRYNPFFSGDDFRLREINLAEFLGMIYLRASSGGSG